MKQEVRIIGGLYRGKKLPVVLVEGLRPTPDRIRETLFNWLMHDIRDSHCLDAFAGSGALGLEAFSRGASNVTFLEYSSVAYKSLQKTINAFNSSHLKSIQTDTLAYLKTTAELYNLVFLDPPYAKELLPSCLEILANRPCLQEGGLVYLESDSALSIDEASWELVKLKRAGVVHYGLLRKR